jgi:hypothetical protein
MEYVKVRWIHQVPEDPLLLLSELDDNRYEVRKVEVYADGRMGYADQQTSHFGAMLGEVPTPTIAELSADPKFEGQNITAEEFESVWRSAVAGDRFRI